MKKIIYTLACFIGFFALGLPVAADTSSIVDEADLFSEEQIQQLDVLASSLNEKIKGDVFIYTNYQSYEDAETFTDNFLRSQVGNDNNGAVFMINMNYRDYFFSTSGNMIDYLTDSRLDTLEEVVVSELSDGNYFEAAKQYLTLATQFVDEGVPSGHYRIDRDTGKITYYKVLTPVEILISIIAAATISLSIFFVIKSRYQLKMGRYRYPYQEKSSLKLLQKEDRLTNSFVRTRRIPKPSSHSGGGSGGGGSTTRSSGGGSFGGRGGKF